MLDASIALAWFLPDEDPAVLPYAAGVLARVRNEIGFAVVPLTWHEEVAHNLGRTPIETYITAYSVGVLLERAQRFNLQAFDAIYLDLALELGLPIATLDSGLRAAARRHGVALVEPEAA